MAGGSQRLRGVEVAAGDVHAGGNQILQEAGTHACGHVVAVEVRTHLKISCIWMISPSMPVISATEVTLRLPSLMRESWTMRRTAAEIWPRIEIWLIGSP